MEQQPPVWRERLFDGAAGELVPERDATRAVREHPRREALIELVDGVAGECFEQPELRRSAVRSPRRPPAPPPRAKACCTGKDSVANSARKLPFSRGERLRHEERISGRLTEELVGVHPVRLRERQDRVPRERWDLESAGRGPGCERAEHHPKRMCPIELVVSVAEDDERGDRIDPSADQPDNVERRLIRPLDVVEDEDRRRP